MNSRSCVGISDYVSIVHCVSGTDLVRRGASGHREISVDTHSFM